MEIEIKNYSPDLLLKNIDQHKAFNYYLGHQYPVEKTFCNPLRPSSNPDNNPSGMLKWYNSRLMLIDFGDSTFNMDLIKLVMMTKLLDFKSAVLEIYQNRDKFKATSDINNLSIPFKNPEESNKRFKFEIVYRPFEITDINYFENQGLNINHIYSFGKIKAADRYRMITESQGVLNQSVWVHNTKYNPIYVFETDVKDIFKIYRPFESKDNKFRYNGKATDYYAEIEGLRDIPSTGNYIIVTKSRKERLFLTYRGFTAINTQGEGRKISVNFMESVLNRFKKSIIFYDRDKEGMLSVKNYWRKNFNSDFYFIPEEIVGKDLTGVFHDQVVNRHKTMAETNKFINEKILFKLKEKTQ